MTESVKMDIMNGPLSYFNGVKKAKVSYRLAKKLNEAKSFMNFASFEAYTPPFYLHHPPYGECLSDSIISGEIEEILKNSDTKEFNINIIKYMQSKALSKLTDVRKCFCKKVKEWIGEAKWFDPSIIYFFHPIDIAENSEEYKEIQAEAKKKKIKLVSVYHKLKDFKLLSNSEIYRIVTDYYDSKDFDKGLYNSDELHELRRELGIYYGSFSAEKYREIILDYEELNE